MNSSNFCIIMAGGIGSRFWPMSSFSCPKQFLDILGTGDTMLQATFKRFESICPRENIFIVTGHEYHDIVAQQIPNLNDYQIVCEPARRNTAPCIAYAGSIIKEINSNANIIVTPSDHAIFDLERFISTIEECLVISEQHDWIITLGIEPTSPNTKYGYIQFHENFSIPENMRLHEVITFTEKPPFDMAQQFLNSGDFLWNSGVFIWNVETMEYAFNKYMPEMFQSFKGITKDTSYTEIEKIYAVCQPISIDYGIIEKAENVHVMISEFGWSDVETWASLYEAHQKGDNNNAIAGNNVYTYEVKNCIVNVPQNKAVVLQGLENYIVVEANGVLMICNRNVEHRILKFASDIEMRNKKTN